MLNSVERKEVGLREQENKTIVQKIKSFFRKGKNNMTTQAMIAEELYNLLNNFAKKKFDLRVKHMTYSLLESTLSKEEARKKAIEIVAEDFDYSEENINKNSERDVNYSHLTIESLFSNESQEDYNFRFNSVYNSCIARDFSKDDAERIAREVTPRYNTEKTNNGIDRER